MHSMHSRGMIMALHCGQGRAVCGVCGAVAVVVVVLVCSLHPMHPARGGTAAVQQGRGSQG